MLCRCEHLTTPDSIFDAISRTSMFSSDKHSRRTPMRRETSSLDMLSKFR